MECLREHPFSLQMLPDMPNSSSTLLKIPVSAVPCVSKRWNSSQPNNSKAMKQDGGIGQKMLEGSVRDQLKERFEQQNYTHYMKMGNLQARCSNSIAFCSVRQQTKIPVWPMYTSQVRLDTQGK